MLLPLVAAAVYAGAASLLKGSPSLAEMVPDDAVATWRFKDLAAYDEARTPPGARYSASDVLGAELNLPAFAGVDRRRPLLAVTLDPTRRADPGYYVLPVEDAAKVRSTFASPDLPERHARAVGVHGDWAAAGWDLLTVDRAGNGHGVYPAERGETWAVAVDWPRFVDAALRPESVTSEPVASVLKAVGFDPATGHVEEGEFRITNPGRVPLVRDAWSRVEMHAFPGRLRVELWPAATDLIQAIAVPPRPPTSPPLPVHAAPSRAEAWLAIEDTRSRRVVALALGYAGLKWPLPVGRDDFAALRLGAEGPLLVYAEPAGGTSPSWTLVLEAPAASMPDLAAFGLQAPAVGAVAPLPEGSAPLSTPYGPALVPGEDAVREGRDAVRIVALGVDARVTADRRAAEAPAPLPSGGREIARFGLSFAAAQRLLGPALSKEGLLSPLAGGALEGSLVAEGTHLVLEVRLPR